MSGLVGLPILHISYKWNHPVCGLWCLASFPPHNVFAIRPHCGPYQSFVPVSVWVMFRWMHAPYFTSPFVNGWTFGRFPLLALVTSAAMKIMGVCLFESWFSILLGKYPGVQLPGHWVVLFNFLRNLQTIFTRWPHYFPLPPAVHESCGHPLVTTGEEPSPGMRPTQR